MCAAPSRIHQKIIREISRKIGNYIEQEHGNCEVYFSPFDVRFLEEGENDKSNKNTVQPDIAVICDSFKLDDIGRYGDPENYTLSDKIKVFIFNDLTLEFMDYV